MPSCSHDSHNVFIGVGEPFEVYIEFQKSLRGYKGGVIPGESGSLLRNRFLVPFKDDSNPGRPVGTTPVGGTKPRFTQPQKMRRKIIQRPMGSSVRLKCSASGQPKPEIIWSKDGRPLTDEDL
ncbi:FGFRL1, partial [Branchiostoma lanceolatum]